MNGFSLMVDPQTAVTRRLKIAAGTAIMQGTVMDQNHSGSATIDVAPSTSSSVTSTIYAVTAETVSSAATSVLCYIITPYQYWSCDTTNTANTAHDGQRMILGTETLTVGTNATPQGNLDYVSNSQSAGNTAGVTPVPVGTALTVTTANNTGSDVTGTTGVFEQLGTLAQLSTTRIWGRFLPEHAA